MTNLNATLIGSRVERIKGEKYQIGKLGSVVEIDAAAGRIRVMWDGDKRTWIKLATGAVRFLTPAAAETTEEPAAAPVAVKTDAGVIVKRSEVLAAYRADMEKHPESYGAREIEQYAGHAADDIAFIETMIPELMNLDCHYLDIYVIDDREEPAAAPAKFDAIEMKAQISTIRNGQFTVADLQQWFSRDGVKVYTAAQASDLRSAIGAAYRQHRDLQDRTAAAGNLTFAKTEETLANALQVAFTNLHERAGSEDPAPAVQELQAGDICRLQWGSGSVQAEVVKIHPLDAGFESFWQKAEIRSSHADFRHHATHTVWLRDLTLTFRPATDEVVIIEDRMDRPGSLGRPGRCELLDELRSEKELRQAAELQAPAKRFSSKKFNEEFFERQDARLASQAGMHHAHLLPDNHFLHIRPAGDATEIELASYEDGALGTGKAKVAGAMLLLPATVIEKAGNGAEMISAVITDLRREVIQNA